MSCPFCNNTTTTNDETNPRYEGLVIDTVQRCTCCSYEQVINTACYGRSELRVYEGDNLTDNTNNKQDE
jgi:C4-type Zn-finger protein